MEPMKISWPPRSLTCGNAARAVSQAPIRLTSSTRRHSSAGIVRAVVTVGGAIPALATAMSRPPKWSTTAAIAAIVAPASVTSAPRPIARGPIRSAAARASPASRSRTATEAPRPCSCRAVSNPIPRAAPVTSATLPSRSYRAIDRQRTTRRNEGRVCP
jgi:hypothetical protein